MDNDAGFDGVRLKIALEKTESSRKKQRGIRIPKHIYGFVLSENRRLRRAVDRSVDDMIVVFYREFIVDMTAKKDSGFHCGGNPFAGRCGSDANAFGTYDQKGVASGF